MGRVMGYSITCALSARGCGRGKATLNMQQCKLGCQEEEGGRRGVKLSALLVLRQPLSLFCGHLVFTFPPAPI